MTRERRRILIQVGLFIITFITTSIAGAEWTVGKSIYVDFSWADFVTGMQFSVPFMLILTVHEFGHYFTARHYRVEATLPYYIPLPPIPFSIGTLGAVIRLRDRVKSKKEHFDIGIAGPLAGFVMAMVVLWYGFTHLPPPEYIFQIHPEYQKYGLDYAEHVYQSGDYIDIVVGGNLIMDFFSHFVADPARMPNPHELMHYPLLFSGFLALIVTSLNLLPVGQLDGGHVLYGLLGEKGHRTVASVIFLAFMFYAGLGLEYIQPSLPASELALNMLLYVAFLFFSFSRMGFTRRDTLMYAVIISAVQFATAYVAPGVRGYSGWLLFGFVIGRFVGIGHPPAQYEEPLDNSRKMLGWLALLLFIMCFSLRPIDMFVSQ